MADLSDLSPSIQEQMAKQRDAALMEKEASAASVVEEPQIVFEWHDSDATTGARGWLVLDKIVNGVSGGGVFMHANTTRDECVATARTMSRKFTVTVPQIGGAKAGIRFDNERPEAAGVLRRFLRDHAQLLRNVWVTAADIGVDSAVVDACVKDDVGLPHPQATLARKYAEQLRAPDRTTVLQTALALPASPFFPLAKAAAGYGVAEAIRTAFDMLTVAPSASLASSLSSSASSENNAVCSAAAAVAAAASASATTTTVAAKPAAAAAVPAAAAAETAADTGSPSSSSSSTPSASASSSSSPASPAAAAAPLPRVAIQGFGTVGSSLAYYLTTRNIARVVGIADRSGFVYAQDGLPVERFLRARAARVERLRAEGKDADIVVTASKTLLANLSDDDRRAYHATPNTQPATDAGLLEYLGAFFAAVGACEIVSPCATRYQITESLVSSMCRTLWADVPPARRLLVCGANNPYGVLDADGRLVEDVEHGVLALLRRSAAVCVVPDWLANAGTASLFHSVIAAPPSLQLDLPADASDEQRAVLVATLLDGVAAPIREFIEYAYLRHARKDARFLAHGCAVLCRQRQSNSLPITERGRRRPTAPHPLQLLQTS